jgi:hypothetical protein
VTTYDIRKRLRNKQCISEDILEDMHNTISESLKIVTQPVAYLNIMITANGAYIPAYNLEAIDDMDLLAENELPLDYIIRCLQTEIDEIILNELEKLE